MYEINLKQEAYVRRLMTKLTGLMGEYGVVANGHGSTADFAIKL